MTVTTAETLAVNGVVLNTLAKNIESLAGRLRVPAIRTDNLIVPGRHGRIHTTTKYYDEGQIILPMWVKGCDDNGAVPSGNNRVEFFKNLDTLTQLFRPGDGLLQVVHTLPDGTLRRAWCETTEAIDFTTMGGHSPLGKFSVALRVPGVFWEDPVPYTINLPLGQNGPLLLLGGTTAPIEDAVFTINGPMTNIRIEALYNGAPLVNPTWFAYNAALVTGQQLIVDCGNWSLVTFGGTGVVHYDQFQHAGAARWMIIPPGPVGQAPGLKVTIGSSGSPGNVVLVAKRKFLVG